MQLVKGVVKECKMFVTQVQEILCFNKFLSCQQSFSTNGTESQMKFTFKVSNRHENCQPYIKTDDTSGGGGP